MSSWIRIFNSSSSRDMMRNAVRGIVVLSALLSVAADRPDAACRRAGPPVIGGGALCAKQGALDMAGFKAYADMAATHTPFTLLAFSLRAPKAEITDPAVRADVAEAARYANSRGLGFAFDLDVRLARAAFRAAHPDELQDELVLAIPPVAADGTARAVFNGTDLSDHMTDATTPYLCLTTRLERVYSFVRSGDGILPETVRDITGSGNVRTAAAGPQRLTVLARAHGGSNVCVMVRHTYGTPDVFAPHLLAFQREIIRSYADVPLAGLLKDEWGFPPDYAGNPAHDRYWYSQAMARAYAERSGGRALVRDALLMTVGEKGRGEERAAAINRYGALCRARNATIEDDYYRAAKETFGSRAAVLPHPTWVPYPGRQEFRKNGLDWWQATRDFGQTDETVPYPCRTSLAKRWGAPLWYNQYYAWDTASYARELWSDALAGGRMNVLPMGPLDGLVQSGLMAGMRRLRALDFIARAPLECPVAVVFGHACAMNWAGPSFNDVGLTVASLLCEAGFPTDLLPSSLVEPAALSCDDAGRVCLGPQRYRAVVLYHPEFCGEKELRFFQKAAAGPTRVFQVGDWTKDEEAHPFDGGAVLDGSVQTCAGAEVCADEVARFLDGAGVRRVTGWSGRLPCWGYAGGVTLSAPPQSGYGVLTDRTYVRIAGERNPSGDAFSETFEWRGHAVTVDAIGFAAIRFASDGGVDAFAAGGLKRVATDGLTIELPERADVGLCRSHGHLRGFVQNGDGKLPDALAALTSDWTVCK